MFSFETLIYGCLMFIVPLHCCQNLTLPNVPTRRLLPGNLTTAASATVWGLNGHRQWLLGARNWITVIIERSDHSLVAYWGLNFCWWLFTTFWFVISKKRKKSCFFEIWKKRKIRILEHWVLHMQRGLFVCLLATTVSSIKNGQSNRGAVWDMDPCVPEKPRVRWGPRSPRNDAVLEAFVSSL